MERQDFLLKQIHQIGYVLRQLFGLTLKEDNLQIIEDYIKEAEGDDVDETKKEVARLLSLDVFAIREQLEQNKIHSKTCTDLILFYVSIIKNGRLTNLTMKKNFLSKVTALSTYAELSVKEIIEISSLIKKYE